jgi:hypothetical protein
VELNFAELRSMFTGTIFPTFDATVPVVGALFSTRAFTVTPDNAIAADTATVAIIIFFFTVLTPFHL